MLLVCHFEREKRLLRVRTNTATITGEKQYGIYDGSKTVRPQGFVGALDYFRGTSLIRNSTPRLDHHRALGIVRLWGAKGARFLVSDVPLFRRILSSGEPFGGHQGRGSPLRERQRFRVWVKGSGVRIRHGFRMGHAISTPCGGLDTAGLYSTTVSVGGQPPRLRLK